MMLRKSNLLFLSLMIGLVLPMQMCAYGNNDVQKLPEWAANLYGVGSHIYTVGATAAYLLGYVAQGAGYLANKTLSFFNYHPILATSLGISMYIAWKQRANLREHCNTVRDYFESPDYAQSLADI